MPHDRRTRRTCLILIGVVCSAVPLGCLRSSNLRPASGSLPELTPAGEPPTDARSGTPSPADQGPGSAPQSTAPATSPPSVQTPSPTLPSVSRLYPTDPTALQTGSPASSVPSASTGAAAIESTPPTIPVQVPANETPKPETTPSSTPLLDAEIQRVEAVTRQHSESLNVSDTAEPSPGASMGLPARSSFDLNELTPVESVSKPAVTTPKAALVEPSPAEPAPFTVLVSTFTEDPPAPKVKMPATIPGYDESSPPARSGVPETAEGPLPAIPRDESPESKQDIPIERASEPVPPNPVEQPTAPRTDQPPRLRIAELRFCGSVHGFGSFDPLDATALKPGQSVFVYCEMAGPEYQAHGDRFVSRLSSHLELRSEGGGPIVWEQVEPIAEDVCRHPRRDYYVWYHIKLPLQLEPGSYRLRVIETDLIAERTTSAELPLAIAR